VLVASPSMARVSKGGGRSQSPGNPTGRAPKETVEQRRAAAEKTVWPEQPFGSVPSPPEVAVMLQPTTVLSDEQRGTGPAEAALARAGEASISWWEEEEWQRARRVASESPIHLRSEYVRDDPRQRDGHGQRPSPALIPAAQEAHLIDAGDMERGVTGLAGAGTVGSGAAKRLRNSMVPSLALPGTKEADVRRASNAELEANGRIVQRSNSPVRGGRGGGVGGEGLTKAAEGGKSRNDSVTAELMFTNGRRSMQC
jgi:hypothetical protein